MMFNHLINQEHIKRIQEHYLPLIQQHASTFRVVDWGSSRGQTIRFQVYFVVCTGIGNIIVKQAEIADIGEKMIAKAGELLGTI